MFKGSLVGIYIAPKPTAAMEARSSITAHAGEGLEGDRYRQNTGTFSKKKGPDREVTLIEAEALDALQREAGIQLAPGETRRNLITRNVPLNHLVNQTFQVGAVVLRGLRLCEPCGHLENLTGKSLVGPLAHRGGLRAQVLTGGPLHVGDAIVPTEAAAAVRG